MLCWYTLYTKPFKEFQVAEILKGRGIEVFLPTIRVWKPRLRREKEEPFFPRYLFARFDVEVLGPGIILWTPGLKRVVGFDGHWTVVPDEVIEYIKVRVQEVREKGFSGIMPGERVRIVAGPFKGLEAIFEVPLPASQRVRVLLEFLGTLRRCELPATWIEKIEKKG